MNIPRFPGPPPVAPAQSIRKMTQDPANQETGPAAAEPAPTAATAEAPEAGSDRPDEAAPDPVRDELERWRELAVRSQADFDNYRKRMAREMSEMAQYSNMSLLQGLLPILDNFDMGLQAAKAEGDGSVIFQGMAMVKKQLEDFLRDCGVEAVEATGKPFDPSQHEAIQQVASDEIPEGHVVHEMRRGYRLNHRLLRAANVTVSTGPESPSDHPSE